LFIDQHLLQWRVVIVAMVETYAEQDMAEQDFIRIEVFPNRTSAVYLPLNRYRRNIDNKDHENKYKNFDVILNFS
jgi:hypothetical protein